MHLVAWKKACYLKDEGGLEIRRIIETNKALLSKWLWRFGIKEGSLWRRVIAEKYGMDSKWQTKKITNSYGVSCWKAIMDVNTSFLDGITMEVGSGEHIHFWREILTQHRQ